MSVYRNIEEIGSGGFGKVWRCCRDEDKKEFAKKVLEKDDPNAIRRFDREVRILSKLDHPNIVKVITKRLRKPPYYYVMPLYEKSLRTEINEITGDADRIYVIFSGIINAMEYAHKQRVIHRDLKPANVLMNNDKDLVLSDFGLGRVIDSDSTRVTLPGQSMGTPFYMAPEQYGDAESADERSDIFSLGRMLYELYTGPLTSAVQDDSVLPGSIRVIVRRCTKAIPGERYQNMEELKQAWESIFEVEGQEEEIKELALLRIREHLDIDKARRLLELSNRCYTNGDSLHDGMMHTVPDALASIYEVDNDAVRHLVRGFCEFTSRQGWPFGYTDKIGNWCERVFLRILDHEMRTDLVICVFEVGVSQNRFHVLDIFRNMMEKVTDTDEVILLEDKLRETSEYSRRNAQSYVNTSRLHSRLGRLFEFDN